MDKKYIDKFYSKISPEPNTGCWLWTAATCKSGYGAYGIKQNGYIYTYKAHRFSAWINGKIPSYYMPEETPILRHICNQRSCVNPDHLEPGTHQDNTNDMKAAGRDRYIGRPKRK